MKKKKYLYLLLLLILPILFFSISKISLSDNKAENSNGQFETIDNDSNALAALGPYTYYQCKTCKLWYATPDKTKVVETKFHSRKDKLETMVNKYLKCESNSMSINNTDACYVIEKSNNQYKATVYKVKSKTCKTKTDEYSATKIDSTCQTKTAQSCSDIPASICEASASYSCRTVLSKCSNYCKGGETFNYSIKAGDSLEIRSKVALACGYGTGSSATSGTYDILQGNNFISVEHFANTSGLYNNVKGISPGTAKIKLYYAFQKTEVTVNITVTGDGNTVNKTAWITSDTTVKNSSGSNETIKKCSEIKVTTCNGNSQGAICSFTYNGKTYSGLNSKYYNTTKPSECSSANSFKVVFNGNGGTFYNTGESTQTKTCNSTSCAIDMPTPTRKNYKFLGYCKNAKTCSKYVQPGRGVVHSAAATYYAQWQSTNSFEVVFNGNGGTFYNTGESIQTKTCNSTSCAIDMPTPTRSNYKFLGYCKNAKACSSYVQPGRGVVHNSDTVYYAQWKSTSTTPSPSPVTPVPTPTPNTETVNAIRYAKENASAGGYKVSCGDEVYVTTCETASSSANPTCTITKVNGVSVNTTTKVYRNQLVVSFDALPASCKEQTRYTLRSTPLYTNTGDIGGSSDNNIPCAESVKISGNMTEACAYSNGQYCKVTYDGTEGYVYRNDLTARQIDKSSCAPEDEKPVEARCYYNEDKEEYIWSEEDLSDKYEIDESAQNEDECNALNGDGEKDCKSSEKQTDVTDVSKKINICYEKKDNKIVENIDVMDMFTCAKDYTQNPVEQTENTCNKVKNGTCHKTYLVSCSNGTRPAVEISASLLNQGLGTITVKGRKISNDVKSYYLDDSSNPTVDSVWKDFADANTIAYEQKPAGLYYAWVRDDQGILSRPMFAIVHDADITNTLESLSVKDANDVAVTLNSIEGENAYLDVMPSGYSLLSNRLKNDKALAGFDSLSMGYKIEVNSDKISVFATLTSDDASYVEGYEPRTVNLEYGENKILIKIKNKSGKVRTYTIIATRTDDRVSNNLLTDLTVSKGKIEFDPYVTDYNIEVPKNTKKVSINGTLASDTSSFVEGNEPREVELTEDITTSVLEVISESGITRSYVLTFIKKGAEEETSTSAYLDTLTIEGTAIDFNKEIYEYAVTVPYEYSSVNVYAFPESDNAFAEVEGDRGLKVGANNLKITVKNGKLTKTYTVTVIRKEAGLEISNDVTLSSLTVKNYGIDFSPEKLDYTVKIKREKSLIITATPTSNRSEVYMYGNNSLTGFSTVRIKVVAENGATNIYSIDIQKDSYNKTLEITAVLIGSVIILGAGIIIVVRKKHKKMKEYLGK